jgi:hypothetical protein
MREDRRGEGMGKSAEKLIRESRGSPHLSLWPSGPTTGAGKAPTGAVDATDTKGNPWGPAARIEGPTEGATVAVAAVRETVADR